MQRLRSPSAFEHRGDHFRYAVPLDFATLDVGALMDDFKDLEERTAPDRQGEPLRVLCDVRSSVNAARVDRRPMYARHHEFAGRRIAILGNSRVQQILFDFLVAATSFRGHARFFVAEPEAVAWLRGSDGS